MENASKALIIAGAILISIVLITFGVIILSQGSEVINNSSLSETEISTFNAKFTSFEGKKVRGSKVNALINTIIQNNLSQDDEGKKIETDGSADITIQKSHTESYYKADSGETYNVKAKYGKSGLITKITINKNE